MMLSITNPYLYVVKSFVFFLINPIGALWRKNLQISTKSRKSLNESFQTMRCEGVLKILKHLLFTKGNYRYLTNIEKM